MKITSAYANKMLKQLDEDKDYWLNIDNSSCVYTASTDEEPVIPEYDFTDNNQKIADINQKICKIKHAINLANVTSQIAVGDKVMSVDMILVSMAQLNRRKNFLDYLRKQQPKQRISVDRYSSRSAKPEYQYTNYDIEVVKKEFERVSTEILQMQMALDKYNQTFEFEVDVD